MLGSLILLWIIFSLLLLLVSNPRPKNFPPGPWRIPILGNLHQIYRSNPLDNFQKLSERYGKIYSLYFGGFPAVVLNGLQAIKEGLVTHSAELSARPTGFLITDLTEGRGITLNNGIVWKMHRRFALTTLRNFGMGKNSMERRILRETSNLVSHLENNAGKIIDSEIMFHKVTCNIMHSILYDTPYGFEDESLQLIINCIRRNNKIFNNLCVMLYDTIPLLKLLPLPCLKACENFKILKDSTVAQISKHKQTWVPGKPRNFVDSFFDEMQKGGENQTQHTLWLSRTRVDYLYSRHDSPMLKETALQGGDDDLSFDERQLAIVLLDLLLAGTDTTANSLLIAFLYLTTHPDVQERCQKEIDEVLGEEEQASFEDRHRMPYTQATIHEAQRVASTLPLNVFHFSSKDTQVMGYNIPKNTVIIPNLTTVLNEENQWKFPHDFNPFNFLNDEEEFVKPEAFIPFSAGPRICPGEGLARMELFLIIVTLLRRFKFVWPANAGVPDYTLDFGITLSPKPFKMDVRLRQAS